MNENRENRTPGEATRQEPYLKCDECRRITYDLTQMAQIHSCPRRGAWRLVNGASLLETTPATRQETPLCINCGRDEDHHTALGQCYVQMSSGSATLVPSKDLRFTPVRAPSSEVGETTPTVTHVHPSDLTSWIVAELFEKLDIATDDPRFWECVGLVANALDSSRAALSGGQPE